MSKPKRLHSLKDIMAQLENAFNSLNNQSDIICAVGTTAFLERMLGSILQEHFAGDSISSHLLTEDGPIGSLAARAKVCYSLGFISATCMETIIAVGNIRNSFAHAIDPETFDSPTIADACRKLRSHFTMPAILPDDYEPMWLEKAVASSPRMYFRTTVSMLCLTVQMAAIQITKCETKTDMWSS